ncbi:MAG: thermonuclease family protein [Hyphomicrobiaceae bacterium]|nr:thermonuclease family protein [Hyphomicrobiaceae bacterium]MCC0011654.1 thermonuclease family protein [Hyphomicrobiaceae bacterium]
MKRQIRPGTRRQQHGGAMFGWRKKQDGFEWHDYVRTTILVRRAKRREKVDDARQAAVDGLKDAGAAAAQGLHNAKGAAADGLRRAGRKGQELGASGASGLVGLALLALINLKRLSRRFAQALKVGWLKISTDGVDLAATLAMPLLSHLADRRTRIIVGAVGIAATIAFAYRTFSFGLDTRAAFAGLIALFTLIPAFLAERHRSDATRRQGATNASLSPRLVLPVLAWGGFAAVLVLGVGSLLKSNDMPLTAAVTGLSAPSNSSKQTRSGHRLPPPPQRQSPNVLRGRAHALTGDTLRIANRIFQLADIEAPERDQTCEHANGRSWRCGEAARSALNRLIGRSAITCTIDNIEANGIASGNCTIGDRDIARELVRAGNVFAEAGFFARLSDVEDEARDNRRGLWDGKAERPESFRAAAWEAAKENAPGACPIKGRIHSSKKLYVMPWMRGYERVRIRTSRGERWFCSEAEARESGWRLSGAS